MSEQPSLLKLTMLPWWFGIILVAAVPFLSILRTGPLNSFFLESYSLFAALIIVLTTATTGLLRTRLPSSSIYFAILAVFWWIQARAMALTYPGLNDMVVWTFVILALTVWACRAWVEHLGHEKTVSVLAWILVWACCIQAAIGWMQYSGTAASYRGWLMYHPNTIEGQLGQRNHFGHYLMWGVLSVGYLWSVRRMTWWFAIPMMLYFGATLGITGSRTVFAYIVALALLLPLWRIVGGKTTNRSTVLLGIATVTVLFGQFAIEPLLQWFGYGDHLSSAAERMSNHAFGQSGRDYEWRKAWHIFLSAPWFGHGWGSYSLQGFLADPTIYANGFRQYDSNVLFTHSHNSLLNLLAEMGIIGTLLVMGGLAWCIRSVLSIRTPTSLFLLSVLSVSLVHSLLEYPLWYIYFLTVFALFIGLMPPKNINNGKQPAQWTIWATIIFTMILMGGIIRLGIVYQDLRHASSNGKSIVEKTEKMTALLHIARTEPMFKYYAQLVLINHIDPTTANIPAWAYQTLHDATRYRPYAHAHKWGLIAYRLGKHTEATHWLHHVYRYYPTKMGVYGAAIMNTPYYEGLRKDFTTQCKAYHKIAPHSAPCPEALPPEPNRNINKPAST